LHLATLRVFTAAKEHDAVTETALLTYMALYRGQDVAAVSETNDPPSVIAPSVVGIGLWGVPYLMVIDPRRLEILYAAMQPDAAKVVQTLRETAKRNGDGVY